MVAKSSTRWPVFCRPPNPHVHSFNRFAEVHNVTTGICNAGGDCRVSLSEIKMRVTAELATHFTGRIGHGMNVDVGVAALNVLNGVLEGGQAQIGLGS